MGAWRCFQLTCVNRGTSLQPASGWRFMYYSLYDYKTSRWARVECAGWAIGCCATARVRLTPAHAAGTYAQRCCDSHEHGCSSSASVSACTMVSMHDDAHEHRLVNSPAMGGHAHRAEGCRGGGGFTTSEPPLWPSPPCRAATAPPAPPSHVQPRWRLPESCCSDLEGI